MIKLVLLRHGQSTWNKENKFTGWTDVPLSEKGVTEGHEAAKLLQEAGFSFDLAYTSILKRGIDTLMIVLEDMQLQDIKIEKSWRLNERHYGALQGLNKAETAKEYGEGQVHLWRRSYATQPPALEKNDERNPRNDPLYKNLADDEIPLTECLKDTVDRVLPYWHDTIVPALKEGKKIIISAHGNSLRALVKYLDNVSDEAIAELNIPTGIPLVYELDDDIKPLKHYYLGDQAAVEAQMKKVADQGKAK